MCGTNPLKVKKKHKTALNSSNTAHVSTIKVDEQPTLFKNCTKIMNSAVVLANATSRSAKPYPRNLKMTGTLWIGGSYISTAAPLTSLSSLRNSLKIKDGDTTLTGSCNAGTTVTNTRGGGESSRSGLTSRG